MAPRKNYTPEQMGKAMEAVRGGTKVAVAAQRYGVPRITLYNKITGKTLLGCTMGPSTVLTATEEEILVKWLLALSDKHFPITKDSLLNSVQKIMIDENRANPFTNNRPGKKWFQSFLKRHPVLVQRTPENLSSARDNVTEAGIRNWFQEIELYLEEKNLKEMVKEPSRIFNADESAFFLSPKPGNVITKKGEKHLYTSCGDDKENLTVLFTANAAGIIAPPMIVFNYERIPANIAASVPKEWGVGKSESGWMCGSTFFEYITNIFNPWLEEMNIEKPVLFFVDGHKSHLTLHLSNFCSENGIEIIALFPNSTHILQPLDLAVFRPLKVFWKKAVTEWKVQNLGQNLRKENFAPLLQKAVTQLTSECVKNGFRAGGLFPFGPDYIDMSKIKDTENTPAKSNPALKEFLKYLESEIVRVFSVEKLNLFNKLFYENRDTIEDSVLDGDISLYVLWAKSKADDLLNNTKSSNLAASSSLGVQEDAHAGSDTGDMAVIECLDKIAPSGCTIDETPDLPKEKEQSGRSSSSILATVETLQEDTQSLLIGITKEQINKTSIELNSEIIEQVLPSSLEPSIVVLGTGDSQSKQRSHEIASTSTPKKSLDTTLGVIVPSPFKRNLFWPEDTQNNKKKRFKKEKIPSAVTGKAWQEYYRKKEIAKKKQQDEKEARAKKRQENKILKEKIAENKKNRLKLKKKPQNEDSTSEDSNVEVQYAESEDSAEDFENNYFVEYTRQQLQNLRENSSDTDASLETGNETSKEIITGNYVIVKYEGEHFPGKVENVEENQYEVSTMAFSGRNAFKWPDTVDKIWYKKENVIEKIDKPICIKRGFYKVKEMQKYLPFLYD